MRYYHVTEARYVASILRNGLRPGRMKRGTGADTTPAVYLFRTEDEAEDGVMNWLGDLLHEDEPLALLAVDLPGSHPLEDDPELDLSAVRSLIPIPAAYIKLVKSDF